MAIYAFLLSFLWAGLAYGKNQSNWPQTILGYSVVQPSTSTLIAAKKENNLEAQMSDTKIVQFDIEVPYYNYFNMGFSGQFMGGDTKTELSEISEPFEFFHYYIGSGGYGRWQYQPTSKLNAFARLDVGAGPYLNILPGIAGMLGLQVGGDFYFSDWFGISLSYGKDFFYGVETFASNLTAIKEKNDNKHYRFKMAPQFFMVGLKTTYF
jgi:hypothetical protein